MSRQLNIFVPHCSSLLTDHRPHGDGLVATGFLRRLGERGHQIYVMAEAVDLKQPLPSNVHVTVVGSKGGLLDRLRYMRAMRTLFESLRRTVPFDVIHQLNPVFTGMSLAMPKSNIPLILGPYVTSWPDDPDATTSSLSALKSLALSARSAIARMQQAQADVLLLTTPAAASRVPDAAGLTGKLQILPHGLDVHFFSPLAQEDLTPPNEDVLFLSNLVERKGILDLVRAFAEVAQRAPLARLLIAGDGPELEPARALVPPALADKRVLFLGRQSREESLALLQRCAIFCQPSHGEPYGMSAAEAMSCAKPLVVTNAGGLAYLADPEGGLQVPMRSPRELADALVELLSDPARRQSMGAYNRERALETMAWERVLERLESIYDDAIEKRRRTSHRDAPR